MEQLRISRDPLKDVHQLAGSTDPLWPIVKYPLVMNINSCVIAVPDIINKLIRLIRDEVDIRQSLSLESSN